MKTEILSIVPTIKEDICKKQQDIIQVQRKQIADLEQENTSLKQQMNGLKEMEQDYNELRGAFASNGNLTYYQAMNPILAGKNAAAEAEKQRYNLQRQQAWEAEQAAIRQAQEEAVRKEYPDLIKYHENRKAKIQQTRDKMLRLASRFYDMNEDEAHLYFADKHRPEKSAIMDMVNEYLDDQNKFTIYQCNYCEKEVYSLGDLERHCYNEGEDHRDATLTRIKDNAIAAMGKATATVQNAIDNAVQAKRNAEYRAHMEEQQAEQAKAKKNLPFV